MDRGLASTENRVGAHPRNAAPERGWGPVRFVKRFWHQFIRDDVTGLAAELAYHFFLAIFPFFIFLAALGRPIASLLGYANPAQQASAQLSQIMPTQAASLFQTEIARVLDLSSPGLLSVGLLGALWAATGGTSAVMKGANRAYSVEETRPLWKRYLVAVGLTVCAAIAIVIGLILVMASSQLGARLAGDIGLRPVFQQVLVWISWPLVALILVLGISVLYRFGSNVHLDWRDVVPGAVVFTIGWLVGTRVFAVYVDRVSSYGVTYGALAGVVILLLWFYFTGLLLLLGLEVGAVGVEQGSPGAIESQQQRTRGNRKIRQLPPIADADVGRTRSA